MNPNPAAARLALLTGLAAVICLDGAVILPFLLAFLSSSLMGFSGELPNWAEIVMFVLAISILAGGGALWGLSLDRLHALGLGPRLAGATAVGFAGPVLALIFILGSLEPAAARILPLPIHRVFSVMFVPAAFLVTSLTGAAVGAALRDRALTIRLAFAGGLAAAIAFLAVNLVLDSLGFRVGAPFAAERATMLVTAFTGNAGAALAGGTLMGWILARRPNR